MEKEKMVNGDLNNVIIPRQAIGKYPNEILGPIFSILPLFYEEDREDSILLTVEDMINYLFFTDKFFLKNIITINNTHLYYIQILKNDLSDLFKVTIQRENMNKFL